MKKLIIYCFIFCVISSFSQSTTISNNHGIISADTLKRNKQFKKCVIQQDVVIQKFQTINAVNDTMLVKLAQIEALVKNRK